MGKYSNQYKISLIFSILLGCSLAACGGTDAVTADKPQLNFAPPVTTPNVDPAINVDAATECSALPGQWLFQDIKTQQPVAIPFAKSQILQPFFKTSFGGTTTVASAVTQDGIPLQVWNEGHRLFVKDKQTQILLPHLMQSILVLGGVNQLTVFVGTDMGLVIAEFINPTGNWQLQSQQMLNVFGNVTSLTSNNVILHQGDAPISMIHLVADDNVYMLPLKTARAGSGCVTVTYQAKDHPVSTGSKVLYHPIKVVAFGNRAAFLTASRSPAEFSSWEQFLFTVQHEWMSFQSTAFLVDVARQEPVVPLIMSIGNFDRLLASDIQMDDAQVFLLGTRYVSATPNTTESGIVVYKNLVGTPIVSDWVSIPKFMKGDFRLGRLAVDASTAYIRGLDQIVRVQGMFFGPSQQIWTSGPLLSSDYSAHLSVTRLIEKDTITKETTTDVPHFVTAGSSVYNWLDQTLTTATTYSPTKIINMSATHVDYLQDKNTLVHQPLNGGPAAYFTIDADALAPRIFHVNELLFVTQHKSLDLTTKTKVMLTIYPNTVSGIVTENSMLMKFALSENGNNTAQPKDKAVQTFRDMYGFGANYRLNDIQEVANPAVSDYRHFAVLVHGRDNTTNSYRVCILQLQFPKIKGDFLNDNGSVELQGATDMMAPNLNTQNNIVYGSADEQPRFMGPLVQQSSVNGVTSYTGHFQHFHPTYNVWSIKIDVTAEDSKQKYPNGKKIVTKNGELTPLSAAELVTSLAATQDSNGFATLHGDGIVRWIDGSKFTTTLDLATVTGQAVAPTAAQIWFINNRYLLRFDNPDGMHGFAVVRKNSSNDMANCPSCQFTDTQLLGNTFLTASPTRGIEVYDLTSF